MKMISASSAIRPMHRTRDRAVNFMHSLAFGSARSILCLGAHADDIEIGCGGTVLSLIKAIPDISIGWIVLSSGPQREAEARHSAAAFLHGAADCSVEISDFRNGFFPYDAALKDHFELLKQRYSPDLILTHRREDRHQDHRTVCELTWNTFRDHLILEYEIPKWDGDMGRPTVYVPLDTWTRDRKVECLMSSFQSQQSRHWYDAELFHGLMRLRGMECNAPDRCAEAFWAPKLTLALPQSVASSRFERST